MFTKKLLFIFVLANILPSYLHSQNLINSVQISKGPELKQKNSSILGLVCYKNDSFYVKKKIKNNFAISKIGPALNETNEVVLPSLKYDGKKQLGVDIVSLKENFFFLSTRSNPVTKINTYLFSPLKKSLQLTGETRQITEMKYLTVFEKDDIYYIVNQDETKVVFFFNDYEKRGEREVYQIVVTDNNLNVLWKKTDTLPYSSNLFRPEQFYLDNLGNVYIIGVEFKEKTLFKRNGEANYKYHVLTYYNQGKKVEDFEVSIPNKFITDLGFGIRANDEMMVTGFYSERGEFMAAGAFYMTIDASTHKTKQISLKDFSFEFVTESFSDRKTERAKEDEEDEKQAELADYFIKEIIQKENGGYVILAEQRHIKITCTMTCTYNYYFNDIIAISVDSSGMIEWNTRLRKKQHTVDDKGKYSSFACAVVQNKIYLLINDMPENLILSTQPHSKLKRYNKGETSVVTIAEIDEKGNCKREALFGQGKKGAPIIQPNICLQYDAHNMFLMGEKYKNYQFFNLRFK